MSNSYYIRSQGKVSGPFTFEDLKAKAGKGHIKRTYQISTDQKRWQPARKIEGLFPPATPPRRPGQPVIEPELIEPELVEPEIFEDEPIEILEVEEDTEWHYCLQGDQNTQGPVSEAKLKRLFQTGRLPMDTMVWNDSLSDWVPASRIPTFSGAGSASSTEVPRYEGGNPGPMYDGEELPTPPMATLSLVLAILGIPTFGITSVPAIILGHMSLMQIQANRQYFQGENTAKTGLIMGYVVLTLALLGLAIFMIVSMMKK